MNIPREGSQVVVTTKHRNTVLGGDPFKFNTYKGVVVKASPWMSPHEFMIATGNAQHPKAIINSGFVHSIDYVSGLASTVNTDSRIFRVTSKSSGKHYVVTLASGKITCTCTGFEYRKHCKHSQAVSQKIKGE